MGKLMRLMITLMCVWTFILDSADGQPMTRQEILSKLLNDSEYDSKIAPNFEYDNATKVTMQVYVVSIHSVSELSMDYALDIFLRQKWFDHRLKFVEYSDTISRLELDQKLIQKVWVPDTIFTNEKKAEFHDVTVPNRLMHLYKNGTVFYSCRISLKLSCPMNLERYPLDSQYCPMYMESYAYSTDNLVFQWHDTEPVKLEEFELPQFYMEPKPQVKKCTKDYGEAGRFTCLQAGVTMHRNTGYYMIQIFVPSMLIVMLSWVSFWIDIDATPARISLGVLTVLTMTTQSSGARASLPRVSYVKAIDVWMSTCLFFVFASLVEFAYANVLLRRKRRYGQNDEMEMTELNGSSSKKNKLLIPPKDLHSKARWVDKVSRVIFPVIFIVFNLVFWIYYILIFTEGNAFKK